LEPPHLTKARIHIARGTDEDVLCALHIIDTLYEIAMRGFNINFQINILSLRALALDMVGGNNGDEAFAALREAVELARRGGYIRLFVDLGLPMKCMLERLTQHGFATETIRSIIAAFPDSQISERVSSVRAGSDAPVMAMDEHLTLRELDVLVLLSKRSSNKEIANQLSISTVTVKRHVANIYGKLGVNRRWDAVIKAETMGLLAPQ
jgi:LuxR family maltose regulon positive regulatory protein